MQDELAHVIAYGAIVLVLVFWPSFEHAAACVSYSGLFALSATTLVFTAIKKRAVTTPSDAAKDLRASLPYWPLPSI